MIRVPTRRGALALIACSCIASACLPSTEPEIELVATPGAFSAVVSGAVAASVSGSAALEASPGALLCPDVALEPTEGDVAIKFGSTADLASPECALLTGSIVYGALAFQPPLVPTVRVPASGNPLLAEYYLVRAGELEILESTPSKLFGRFDFEAATTDGTTIKAIRVRGSFWVVP